jgi:hypothetical protein
MEILKGLILGCWEKSEGVSDGVSILGKLYRYTV